MQMFWQFNKIVKTNCKKFENKFATIIRKVIEILVKIWVTIEEQSFNKFLKFGGENLLKLEKKQCKNLNCRKSETLMILEKLKIFRMF